MTAPDEGSADGAARRSDSPARAASGDLADAFERIATQRRSAYAYLPDPVPRAMVERALRLAMLAPNHHKTRPWRFYIYEGEGRAPLVAAYEAAATRLGRDVAKARQRALDAPVMIVVGCVPLTAHPKVKPTEEAFAVAAAVQNMLLALASEGVDSLITTGDLAESAEMHALVGLDGDTGRIMAVVNVGYRDPRRPVVARTPPDVGALAHWFTT